MQEPIDDNMNDGVFWKLGKQVYNSLYKGGAFAGTTLRQAQHERVWPGARFPPSRERRG